MNIYIKGKDEQLCVILDDGTTIHETHKGLTDNQCEWRALVASLNYIFFNLPFKQKQFSILTDSLLLFKQLEGIYRIKSKRLKPIYFEWNRFKNMLYEANINYKYTKPLDNVARKYLQNEN